MAEIVGTGEVIVLPNAKAFGAALTKQVTPQISGLTKGLSGVGGPVSKLSSLFTAFGGSAALGIGVATAAVVEFGIASVKSYGEHQVALLQLQTALRNSPQLIGATTAAFEAQATALQNLTGVQDEEILNADAVLAKFNLTANQLQRLTPLVLDYARATGTDTVTAAGNLGRAALGNARALKAIGINFKATGDRAVDFERIMQLLQDKVAGVAEGYGKTIPGKLDILAAKFDDLKERAGLWVYDQEQGLERLKKDYDFYFNVQANNLRVEAEALAENDAKRNKFRKTEEAGLLELAAMRDAATRGIIRGAEVLGGVFGKATAFKEWEHKAVDSFNGVMTAMDALSGQAHVTAREVLKSFDKQLTAIDNYQTNWEKLTGRGLPAEMLKQIRDMGLDGAGLVKALANANEDQFNRIVSDWLKAGGKAKDVANDVEGLGTAIKVLPNGKVIKIQVDTSGAREALAALERQMSGLRSQGGSQGLNFHVAAGGYDGMVRQPTLFLTGEAGPEHVKVTPSSGSSPAGQGGGHTFVFNGDVYGMDDFERKVGEALAQVYAGSVR